MVNHASLSKLLNLHVFYQAPRPAFRRLKYRKIVRGLYPDVTHMQRELNWTWVD